MEGGTGKIGLPNFPCAVVSPPLSLLIDTKPNSMAQDGAAAAGGVGGVNSNYTHGSGERERSPGGESMPCRSTSVLVTLSAWSGNHGSSMVRPFRDAWLFFGKGSHSQPASSSLS